MTLLNLFWGVHFGGPGKIVKISNGPRQHQNMFSLVAFVSESRCCFCNASATDCQFLLD